MSLIPKKGTVYVVDDDEAVRERHEGDGDNGVGGAGRIELVQVVPEADAHVT